MNQKKWLTILLAAAVAASAFTGCGGSAETVDISQQPKQGDQGQEQPGSQRERGIMAKVVSLNGNQLTVILADMQERDGGGAPPSDGGGSAVPPGSENGQMPDPSAGPGQPGQGGRELEFTGDEVTYTLSGSVSITKGMGENASDIDLSELRAGDVIRFTASTGQNGNETIETIVVMD